MWKMMRGTEGAAKEYGVGWRVTCIGLALSNLVLLRATEWIAGDEGRVHIVYCLKIRGVAFYAGERQVERGDRPELDTVKVRFKGSNGH